MSPSPPGRRADPNGTRARALVQRTSSAAPRVVVQHAADGSLMIPSHAGTRLHLCPHPRTTGGSFATDNADAKIKPVPRPAKVTKEPANATRSSPVAPVRKPAVHRKVVRGEEGGRPSCEAAPSTAPPASCARPYAPPRTAVRQRWRRSASGACACSLAAAGAATCRPLAASEAASAAAAGRPVVPKPTPLGFVASGELLPSSDDPWPSWVFSLLGVMAAAEISLLVHLARAQRSFA